RARLLPLPDAFQRAQEDSAHARALRLRPRGLLHLAGREHRHRRRCLALSEPGRRLAPGAADEARGLVPADDDLRRPRHLRPSPPAPGARSPGAAADTDVKSPETPRSQGPTLIL